MRIKKLDVISKNMVFLLSIVIAFWVTFETTNLRFIFEIHYLLHVIALCISIIANYSHYFQPFLWRVKSASQHLAT